MQAQALIWEVRVWRHRGGKKQAMPTGHAAQAFQPLPQSQHSDWSCSWGHPSLSSCRSPQRKAVHGEVSVRASNERIGFHITATPKQVHSASFIFLMAPTGKNIKRKEATQELGLVWLGFEPPLPHHLQLGNSLHFTQPVWPLNSNGKSLLSNFS